MPELDPFCESRFGVFLAACGAANRGRRLALENATDYDALRTILRRTRRHLSHRRSRVPRAFPRSANAAHGGRHRIFPLGARAPGHELNYLLVAPCCDTGVGQENCKRFSRKHHRVTLFPPTSLRARSRHRPAPRPDGSGLINWNGNWLARAAPVRREREVCDRASVRSRVRRR